MDEQTKVSLERLEKHLVDMEGRLNERVERIETSLLTEFHKWASPIEMRQRSHAMALRAMDLEIESHGDRLNKLEEKQ